MRHGRAKAARKTLKFFLVVGNIKPPYKVILDGNFIVSVLQQKVPLRERISRLLQGEQFLFFVTRETLNELETLSNVCAEKRDERTELFRRAKQYGLDECEIIEEQSSRVASAGDALKAIVSNERNSEGYFVASQDEQLTERIRELPNVPILRLSRAVLLLEAPSAASRRNASKEERNKLFDMNDEEKQMVSKVKDAVREHAAKNKDREIERRRVERIKPKAKGPNPLSCKKRKSTDRKEGNTEKKRRRKKKSSIAKA